MQSKDHKFFIELQDYPYIQTHMDSDKQLSARLVAIQNAAKQLTCLETIVLFKISVTGL
jgi:hypothetical protein